MMRFALGVIFAFQGFLFAVESPETSSEPPAASKEAGPAREAESKHQGAAKPVSEAEQITRLQRAIEADESAMSELRSDLNNPDSEYNQAQADFEELDDAYQEIRKQLEEGRKAGADPATLETLAKKMSEQEKPHALAKERFDLAIEERKLLKEKIATLEKKLAQERTALAKLTGDHASNEEAGAKPAPAPGEAASETSAASAPTATDATAVPTKEGEIPATAPAGGPEVATPAAATSEGAPAKPAATATSTTGESARSEPPSAELNIARKDAQEKAARAKHAETEATTITERMSVIDQTIQEERRLLTTSQRKADNAHEMRAQLARELQGKSAEHADPAEIRALMGRIHEADTRIREARTEVRERSTRLDELQTERASVQAEQLDALRKATAARAQLAIAERQIEQLQNPFAAQNVARWLLRHGPPLLAVLIGIVLLQTMSRFVSRQVVELMSRGAMSRQTREERENRARTLVGVFQNAASTSIVVAGILMMFQEVGIPIAPLMGGAAVVGLAVAFGAQNLIRDYFYGFVILLENQFTVNDVVKIGAVSGQVEQITLRMTVLRDLDGNVHFLPNGEITSVTNMTHGWSRALFDIGVAYKEDADEVMKVLTELGRELRRDPLYGLMILEDLTMLGVDSLGDSAVVIKFYIKTRPLQQWTVKRELLRRIKRRFDELNIEIPFPHRTVYYHNAAAPAERPELLTPGDEPRPRVHVLG